MMFVRTFIFFLGVLATVFLGWAALVGVPDAMISEVKPPPGLQRYTDEQLFGRSIYIREVWIRSGSFLGSPLGPRRFCL